MADPSAPRAGAATAVLLGLAGSALLAALWSALRLAPPPAAGYELTRFVAPRSWGFAAASAVVAALLGWRTRRPALVALGMLLPLPAACSVEVARDPTSHNLIPLEIVLEWVPAYALALAAAYAGRRLRRA